MIYRTRETRRERRLARTRERRRRQLIVLAALTVVLGLVLIGNIGWFYLHSYLEGNKLIAQESQAIARAHQGGKGSRTTCPGLTDTSTSPQGILEAKQIGLRAPVMGGVTDAQLNIAVGHVPGSAWPGQAGTSVLAAHDITYFSGLTGLHTGDRVAFLTPCFAAIYEVTGHQIVTSGSAIYSNPNESLLVLETCYPTDALFLTSQRYLVTARRIALSSQGTPIPTGPAPSAPTVPVPSQLAMQGLTLDTNAAPMGVENFAGTPSPEWRQSSAPFADESAVLTAYFGALRAMEQRQSTWWTALAPTVPPLTAAIPLFGASIAHYQQPVDITLSATANAFTGAQIDTTITIRGGSSPGTYKMLILLANEHGVLQITGWTMTAE